MILSVRFNRAYLAGDTNRSLVALMTVNASKLRPLACMSKHGSPEHGDRLQLLNLSVCSALDTAWIFNEDFNNVEKKYM